MKRRWASIIVLAIVTLAVVGAAPGWAGGPKGKVVIWFDSGAAWNGFIADFNKDLAAKYPDITVEWVTQDTAQLSAKLVTAFAAKQGPDIAMGSQYRLVTPEQQF
jgi:ABC-type glycerol-3-phosphate transport system substrate-binding protein